MKSTICKNCGGEKGIHRYDTGQCPVNGKEAPVGKPDAWTFETFQPEEDTNEIEKLRADNKLLKEINASFGRALTEIKQVAEVGLGEWYGVAATYIPESLHPLNDIIGICEEVE